MKPPMRLLTAVLLCALASTASANGVIIIPPHPFPIPRPRPIRMPRPQPWRNMTLEVKRATLSVSVDTGSATTSVDEVFHNPWNRRVEGTFLFPLPKGAAISAFSMFVNGKELKGELLDRAQANKVYEDIVRRALDPAILEYAGRRLFRARIFPIPARGDVRIKFSYSESLPCDAGVYSYRYPLDTNKFSPKPLQSLVISVKARSDQPLRTVYSPTHKLDVRKKDDHNATASYEARNVTPDRDFVLYCTVSEASLGVNAVTYKRAGEDGFFLMLVSPQMSQADRRPMAKDVALVFDTSGSMNEGGKMAQARRALTYCLNSLGSEDRFALIDFSTTARSFRRRLVKASRETVAEAVKYAQGLEARGGTNIEEALRTALDMGGKDERPYYVIFLTDGLPTIGEDNAKKLSQMASKLASKRVRLFTFGVGNDVNTALLDTLAEENRGDRAYVAPGENIEQKVSSFYSKISHPVLSDVKIEISGVDAYDIFPRRVPDIFRGSQLAMAGRFRKAGAARVVVTGGVNGKSRSYTYQTAFTASDAGREYLPRLWAVRKVGYLLDEIRLRGSKPELRKEVVRLSKRYGIMTPYTAYLVLEGEPPVRPGARRGLRPVQARVFRESMARFRKDAAGGAGAPATMAAPRSFLQGKGSVGRGAVWGSKALKRMREGAADEAEASFLGSSPRRRVRQVGDRTFYFDGERWIVSLWKEGEPTKKVKYMSTEYFRLIRAHPQLARAFALGKRVIAERDGKFYEVVE